MSTNDKKDAYNNIVTSESAFNTFVSRFIDPWRPLLLIDSTDGIRRVWDKETLVGLSFPRGYSAWSGQNDISATQHEAGHFITVPEHRAVCPRFGFHGGIPLLGFKAPPVPSKANSFDVEAKAMAWEVILMRDIHGFELDPLQIASSLKYTNDFWLYDGKTDDEKIQLAASKIKEYVSKFEGIDQFEQLWTERCSKLPDLLRRETIRSNIAAITSPIETILMENVVDDWIAEIRTYQVEDITQAEVTFILPRRLDLGSYHDLFDTKDQAIRFVERVRNAYRNEPGSLPVP